MTAVRLGSGAPWEAVVGYSRVVVHGDSAWVSGTTAIVDGAVAHPGDAAGQTRVALATIARALTDAGFELGDVVRTRIYVTDISRRSKDLVPLTPRKLSASLWTRPRASMDAAMLVEIEADAVRGAGA